MSGFEIGIYGKLPAHGDFINVNVSAALSAELYEWCNSVIFESREKLGDVPWLKSYLVSPVWRFCLPAPEQAGKVVTGVMLPSVDAAGRYFPLFLMHALDGSKVQTQWLFKEATPLLQALEQSGMAALQQQLNLNDLKLLVQQKTSALTSGSALELPTSTALVQRRLPLLLELTINDAGGSLWWSAMSLKEMDKPFCSFAGLPEPQDYEALITGNGF